MRLNCNFLLLERCLGLTVFLLCQLQQIESLHTHNLGELLQSSLVSLAEMCFRNAILGLQCQDDALLLPLGHRSHVNGLRVSDATENGRIARIQALAEKTRIVLHAMPQQSCRSGSNHVSRWSEF